MELTTKFALALLIVVVPTAAGYFCRRTGLLSERVAWWAMTFMAVVGYPLVGFLTIWKLRPRPEDFWLPTLGMLHVTIMALASLAVGRFVTRDRAERGLFAIASSLGNTGFTMGGLVIFFLFAETGLALVSIYCLIWTPLMVVLLYPIALAHADEKPAGSLGMLMLKSIFDWRAIALPVTLVALGLSFGGVPRPAFIDRWHLVDILMYTVTPVAFFGIGLRLHFSYLGAMRKTVLAMLAMRHVVGLGLGLALIAMTHLTPWPLIGISRDVMVVESFVPIAVTCVAIANMFHLKPREASVLFVVSTLFYVIVCLPIVFWLFR